MPQTESIPPQRSVSFSEALKTWLRIACLSFGGPAAQIAVMHRIVVEEKKWINENRFLHALNYCMLLPGPEAQQLVTYLGWLLHGWRGGLTAGLLFVLPGFLSILGLSLFYVSFRENPIAHAALFGLKAAVLVIVLEAVIRIGKKVLKNKMMWAIAGFAFTALFFFNLPFPLVIGFAALTGFLGGKIREDLFYVIKGHKIQEPEALLQNRKLSLARAFRVLCLWLTLWFVPIALLAAALGQNHVLVKEALFFSKAAMITFGGAYSVLSYIAQQAVHSFGWLSAAEMMDGLGFAETTPGPLIQVVQFVGFMGAYRSPEPFSPLTAALLGSLITTWVTYAPCFLWIFLGAPSIEHLRGNKNLNCALSAVTAAVTGVILNLAVWFALHALFGTLQTKSLGPLLLDWPVWTSLDGKTVLISAIASVMLFKFRWPLLGVILLGIICGWFLKMPI